MIPRFSWLAIAVAVAVFTIGRPEAPVLLAADTAEKGEAGEHGHAGGHADPDLSHANASDELSTPAQLKFDLAVATFVVFLLLVALLGKFAWGPISQGLDKREQHISSMIANAEQNARESEARLRELEARLAAQAEEARQALSAARREGEIIKEKLVAEAHTAAQQEKERAIAEIRTAKNVALREISHKSVNMAVNLAKSLIHREVRAADHVQLINDSLATFGDN